MEIEAKNFFYLLPLLVINIWAILDIAKSTMSTGGKIAWVVLICILPLFGFILWFTLGSRSSSANSRS
ncbi:hypothetical conserved protein [Candidatus Nitrosoglobus terrae]|uniref:Hypothetical conserved protein n=1 Tax=Candidatus Nitrosoglobus terrae TaxID=1630141 RepID=A0A1Q2SKR5_9GAMM|nr:PLDc N-terminal domain-containing protein [Candidatus Nitrosoglobus terrae]BAW79718.1 hypothetical conserved protein [Candidatus Nitrosoglobus terrae]